MSHAASPEITRARWWAVPLIAATAFSSASAVQEIDRSLREFSAPTPAELYHMLSFYIPVQESQPTLDSDQIDELERKGREFLSSMTPEQQERALLFAHGTPESIPFLSLARPASLVHRLLPCVC